MLNTLRNSLGAMDTIRALRHPSRGALKMRNNVSPSLDEHCAVLRQVNVGDELESRRRPVIFRLVAKVL